MKKYMMTVVAVLLNGCASDSTPKKASVQTPINYCESVGGDVKTVGNGAEAYCMLPSGDVVEVNEFYRNNH